MSNAGQSSSGNQFENTFGHGQTIIALAQVCQTSIAALINALNDPTNEYRDDAAFALGEIGKHVKNIVPLLIRVLGDVDEAVCQHAASALAHIGKLALPALIEALTDEDPEVRFYAATALADFAEPAVEAVPALIDALCSDFCGVRWVAVDALMRIGTPEAREAVELYKKHEAYRYQSPTVWDD